MTTIYEQSGPDGVRIDFYPAQTPRAVVVFGEPGADGDAAFGGGAFNRELGLAEIDVTGAGSGFPGSAGEISAAVGRSLPPGTAVLCLGRGPGAYPAALLAEALGCDFYVFDPEPEAPAGFYPDGAGDPSGERPCSLAVYDPCRTDGDGRPVCRESAAGIAARFGCGVLPLPYAGGAPAGPDGGARGLADLIGDYFAGGEAALRAAARPETAPRPAKKVAVCCTSNAVRREGFVQCLADGAAEGLEFRQFSVGGVSSIGPVMTCLEHDIPDEYDVCVVDSPITDILHLERLLMSEHEIVGSVYALLSLFDGKRCKLVFLLHAPKHLPNPFKHNPAFEILRRYAAQVTLVDYSSGRIINYAESNYVDPPHFNAAMQYQIAKHLRMILSAADSLPNVWLGDFRPPRFALLSRAPRFADKFTEIRETSLLGTRNLVLRGGDGFFLGADDAAGAGLRPGLGKYYLAAVKYWVTERTLNLCARADGGNLLSAQLKRNFLNVVFIRFLNWGFSDGLSLGPGGEGGAGGASGEAELWLADMLLCDADLAELGRDLAEYWGIPSYFTRYKIAADRYRAAGDFRSFDLCDGVSFIDSFLKLLPAPSDKIAFLAHCLERTVSLRSEVLERIGDVYYREEQRPDLAERAYLDAVRCLTSDQIGLFLKLTEIYIFRLKDFGKARAWIDRLSKLPFGNVHENWKFCRHAFLVYRRFGDRTAALYHGKKMCEKMPGLAGYREDFRNFCREAGIGPDFEPLAAEPGEDGSATRTPENGA